MMKLCSEKVHGDRDYVRHHLLTLWGAAFLSGWRSFTNLAGQSLVAVRICRCWGPHTLLLFSSLFSPEVLLRSTIDTFPSKQMLRAFSRGSYLNIDNIFKDPSAQTPEICVLDHNRYTSLLTQHQTDPLSGPGIPRHFCSVIFTHLT